MKIIIEEKFSEQHIDGFITKVYQKLQESPSEHFIFDLTTTKWISNQGLLLLKGLCMYLLEKEVQFEILFIKKGTSTKDVPKKVAIQIILMWETWKIWKIIPDQEYRKYLGIDSNTIKSLKEVHDISLARPDIFESFQPKNLDSYEITPFVCLNDIKNPEDDSIVDQLKKYHFLNEVTINILREHNCDHPFVNDLFGEIISKEIYENFLNHYGTTFFNSVNNYAFFNLSLNGKIDENHNDSIKIQKTLDLNFKKEELPESRSFFYDYNKKSYKNFSYISYSFLDFGEGIPKSLLDEYQRQSGSIQPLDDDIIDFAFRHDTSKNPVKNIRNGIELKDFIPRGLFDIITLTKRYSGLLIIRSGHGKVLYDFSNTKNVNEAKNHFGNSSNHFPGTFITIYLPAIQEDQIDTSVIKPDFEIPKYSSRENKYLSLKQLIETATTDKNSDDFNQLFHSLHESFKNLNPTLTYLSLEGISNKQLIKKAIFFLVANYDINTHNNVIILHPPQKEFLDELNFEILSLSQVILNYKIHPLPFIYYDEEQNDVELYWLGIFDDSDRRTLNDLLYEQFSLAKSDFNDPNSIIGHLNFFDEHGNLKSNFPERSTLIEFYKKGDLYARVSEAKRLIERQCISQKEKSIFLCNGNYYQTEYLELITLLQSDEECAKMSKLLFDILIIKLDDDKIERNDYKFISVTSTSQRILDSLVNMNAILESQVISIDNYHDLSKLENAILNESANKEYILVCDAISTGYLVTRIENILNKTKLLFIAVVANTIEKDSKLIPGFYERYYDKIVSIVNYPIVKYLRDDPDVKSFLENRKVIRINPYTNIPISLSINETNPNSIILEPHEFLKFVENEEINIGFLKFNNLIHPYFFDTKSIINRSGTKLIKEIFTKRNDDNEPIINIATKNLRIFYPKSSDIRFLDFKEMRSSVFKDHSIREFKLERFNVEDGWKFPHTTDHFGELVNNNPILIIDDGTCSGDSLTQMLNEITFFKPKKISILCLVGRLEEHRREFLSSISQISKSGTVIPVEIYFGTQWHIPTYYASENPNTLEYSRLKELSRLTDIPTRIGKYASRIAQELSPKDIEKFTCHKYLPRKKLEKVEPRKEIIEVRNEIGKVIGFRFYIESFAWFDTLIKEFEKEDSNWLLKTELLCANISFEPYIFDRLSKILPDVTEILENFISMIVFDKEKKIEELNYQWDSRDFIHLLFIVFPKQKLINKLKADDNFLSLINFIELNNVEFEYFLLKLLHLFPLSKDEAVKREPVQVQALLKRLLKQEHLNPELIRHFNIFWSFIRSLPANKPYRQQLIEISNNYENLDRASHHDTPRTFLSLLLSKLKTFESGYSIQKAQDFENIWKKEVARFIWPILSFSKSYKDYVKLTRLSEKVRDINEQILSLVIDPNVQGLQKKLLDIDYEVFSSDSKLFKLFKYPFTYDIEGCVRESLREFIENGEVSIESNIKPDIQISVPYYVFKYSALEPIKNNFRHRNPKADPFTIKIDITPDETYISILIENMIGEDIKPGSGQGSSKLEKAKSLPYKVLKYKSEVDKIKFKQVLELRINN